MSRRSLFLIASVLLLFLVVILVLSWPVLALAAPAAAAGTPSWWGPTILSGLLDLVVVLVALWVREGVRRQWATQQAFNDRLGARQDKLDGKLAETREQYATKAEMREMEAAIRAQLLDTRQQIEHRVDRVETRVIDIEREVGGLRVDVSKLLDLLTPQRR